MNEYVSLKCIYDKLNALVNVHGYMDSDDARKLEDIRDSLEKLLQKDYSYWSKHNV